MSAHCRACLSSIRVPYRRIVRITVCSTLPHFLQRSSSDPISGFDCEKSVYQAKLKEIVDAFAPADGRSNEAENRPGAIAELQAQITRFAAFAVDASEAYDHIKAEDKEKVAAESKKAEEWLAGMSAKLEGLAMTDEPPVKVSELQAKTSALIGARPYPL